MFRIRKEQMAVFSEVSIREFEARVLAYLVHEYPQEYQVRGEERMRQLIWETMERTKPYDLNSESGVIVCAELCIIYGEDFYNSESWASYILDQPELDADMKVERLRGYLGK